jgi:hypothetical protein
MKLNSIQSECKRVCVMIGLASVNPYTPFVKCALIILGSWLVCFLILRLGVDGVVKANSAAIR